MTPNRKLALMRLLMKRIRTLDTQSQLWLLEAVVQELPSECTSEEARENMKRIANQQSLQQHLQAMSGLQARGPGYGSGLGGIFGL